MYIFSHLQTKYFILLDLRAGLLVASCSMGIFSKETTTNEVNSLPLTNLLSMPIQCKWYRIWSFCFNTHYTIDHVVFHFFEVSRIMIISLKFMYCYFQWNCVWYCITESSCMITIRKPFNKIMWLIFALMSSRGSKKVTIHLQRTFWLQLFHTEWRWLHYASWTRFT